MTQQNQSVKTSKIKKIAFFFMSIWSTIFGACAQSQYTNVDVEGFEQAIKNDSTPSGVLFEHAGDIYYHVGKPTEALVAWQKALELGNKSATLKKKIELKKYIAE